MNSAAKPQFEFDWRNDLTIRCIYSDVWVDFGTDLGGGDKDFLLERKAVRSSGNVPEGFEERAREALVQYLQTIGYRVVDLDY